MSDTSASPEAPLDLSKWKNTPWIMIGAGVVAVALGGVTGHDTQFPNQFAFSWLTAYMFYLSLGLGGLFLTMAHHLFDASWSVATRRICEQLGCLLGWPMLILFLPNAIHVKFLYSWVRRLEHPDPAHPYVALNVKHPLYTMQGFYITAIVCFAIWWFLSNRLRYWSLRQDETGEAVCTQRMRFLSCLGIVLFALTVTLAAIMWIQGVMFEWYSTMFGVWYFAASVWTTLATVYVLTSVLQRTTKLREIVRGNTFYMIGSLLFAFTVFYAYASFFQYFIIWNANLPEETFWYVLRERGTWWFTGAIIIIIGHFFVPFLGLLRIDVKLKPCYMYALAAWCWLMHFIDLEFQIMPALHPDGVWKWAFPFITPGLLVDVGCWLLIGGILAKIFVTSLMKHPLYPQKDPRMAEAMDVYVAPGSSITIRPEH